MKKRTILKKHLVACVLATLLGIIISLLSIKLYDFRLFGGWSIINFNSIFSGFVALSTMMLELLFGVIGLFSLFLGVFGIYNNARKMW